MREDGFLDKFEFDECVDTLVDPDSSESEIDRARSNIVMHYRSERRKIASLENKLAELKHIGTGAGHAVTHNYE